MRIRAVFHPSVVCGRPDEALSHAASLMQSGGFGALPVYEGDRLIGILTERDLVAAVAAGADPAATTIGSYMSVEPVTADPEEDSVAVAERMARLGVRHLPVVEQGRLIGMVSARDLLVTEAWPRVPPAAPRT